jgi:Lipocalin-like domain
MLWCLMSGFAQKTRHWATSEPVGLNQKMASGPGAPVTYPLGPDAEGLIMYTHDGYMSAQLMRPDRPDYDQPDTAGGTAAQHAAAAAGYLAYSGPYAVDEATGIVHHEVVVSPLANWLGTVQLRHSSARRTGSR